MPSLQARPPVGTARAGDEGPVVAYDGGAHSREADVEAEGMLAHGRGQSAGSRLGSDS